MLVALGAALVAGILYGVIAGSIEREVGYAAVGVGFLVGFAASKVGGSNPAVIAASAVFSIGAVYLGQLVGISMVLSDLAQIPFSEVIGDHFDTVTEAWSQEADFMTYLFLGLAAVAAVGGAKKSRLTPGGTTRKGPDRHGPGPSVSVRTGDQRRCCESATVTSTRWNSLRSL